MVIERTVDRRLYPRVAVVGSAIVLATERYGGTYAVENLSASGALLVGDTRLAVGDRVRVLVQLHGQSRRFALNAVVVRHASRGPQGVFAVTFVSVPDALRDSLQSAVLHQLQSPPVRGVVLIVEPGPEEAEALKRDIEPLGWEAAVVQRPLDAIIWFQAPERRVVAVVAGAALPGIDGLDLLVFIGADYPQIRRVLACTGPTTRLHREAVDTGHVHAVLTKPWTQDSLLEAVGKEPPHSPHPGR